MSQPELNELTTLTLTAVKTLLRTIAAPDEPVYIASGALAGGTKVTFAAQALRDMLNCPPLAEIVKNEASLEKIIADSQRRQR